MAKRDKGLLKGAPVSVSIPSPAGGVRLETFIPWTLVKRSVKREVITPLDTPEQFRSETEVERQVQKGRADSPLLRALGLAHHWQRLLDEGKYRTLTEIAVVEGIDLGQASRIARLTQLAPDIVEACLSGTGQGLTLERLIRRKWPADWGLQRDEGRPT